MEEETVNNEIVLMHHDVFISYSSRDKAIADALVHFLEESKIRCWIAPRDIPPGSDYAEVIDGAILGASIFLLVFSADSQESSWCRKEVSLALADGKTIVPIKIEDIGLTGAMRLYLIDRHWIDAYPDPSKYFSYVSSVVKALQTNSLTYAPIPKFAGKRRFTIKWEAACFFMGLVMMLASLVLVGTVMIEEKRQAANLSVLVGLQTRRQGGNVVPAWQSVKDAQDDVARDVNVQMGGYR